MSADRRERKERGITAVTSARTGVTRYEVRWSWTDTGGVRRSGSARCRTLAEARKRRAAEEAKIAAGTAQQPSRETLAQYAARWFPRRERSWATSTTYTRRRQWDRHLKPRMGGLRLTQITRAHCQRLVDELSAEGLGPRTIAGVRDLLSGLLRAAVADGLLERNVCRDLELPAAKARRVTVWTLEQMRTFLTATAGQDDHPLYVLLLSTGMRIGEALALRWPAVDLDAATVTVTDTVRRQVNGTFTPAPGTKSDRARVVPLTPACVSALMAQRTRQAERRRVARTWDIRNLVFSDDAGRPLWANTVRLRFLDASATAGLPPTTLHGLRHAWATVMLQSGVHPRIVSDILGHRKIAITLDTYSHVSTELRAQAVATVAAMLDPEPVRDNSVKTAEDG